MPYDCPADLIHGEDDCSRTFGSENGAVMHALNKQDDYHDCVKSKPDAYDVLPDDEDESGGSTSTQELPDAEIPEVDDGGSGEIADCPNCGASTGMSHDEAMEFVRSNTVELPDGREVRGAFCDSCGHLLRPEGAQ